MNNLISKNIRKYRELKGYSQEYMAHELDITQASYAKIENNSTKINVERLFTIAKVLEIDIKDLLDINKLIIYKENNTSYKQVQNLHQDSKEAYEQIIKAKDEQIALLKAMLRQYVKDL